MSVLPPTEDINKQKFYRLDAHYGQIGVNQIPVMIQATDEFGELIWEDEEKTIPKMVQDTDEEGVPIFAEEPIIESVTEWIFDEEDYNTWKAEQEAIVPESTNSEKIITLNEMVMQLTDMIISLTV